MNENDHYHWYYYKKDENNKQSEKIVPEYLSSKVFDYLKMEYDFDVNKLSKHQKQVVMTYIKSRSDFGVSNIAGYIMNYFKRFGH